MKNEGRSLRSTLLLVSQKKNQLAKCQRNIISFGEFFALAFVRQILEFLKPVPFIWPGSFYPDITLKPIIGFVWVKAFHKINVRTCFCKSKSLIQREERSFGVVTLLEPIYSQATSSLLTSVRPTNFFTL